MCKRLIINTVYNISDLTSSANNMTILLAYNIPHAQIDQAHRCCKFEK